MSKRYIVVWDQFLPDLQEEVNRLLDEGYQPLGNLIVIVTQDPGRREKINKYEYLQAMLKPAEIKEEV